MNQPFTVVLPMHNHERQIRSIVHDILDLSVTLNTPLDLVIVDDGSSDDTFESACELARRYPRITVLRQPFRSGLASVLELVRNRMPVELAIVHDGISPVDSNELKRLIVCERNRQHGVGTIATLENIDARGSRRVPSLRPLQQTMEAAHRSVLGFTWLRMDKAMVPRRRQAVEQAPKAPVIANLPIGNLATSVAGFNMPSP